MPKYRTLRLRFLPQVALKIALLGIFLLVSAAVFDAGEIPMLARGWEDGTLLPGAAFLAVAVSAIQVLLLTDALIGRMPFALRCLLAAALTELTVLGVGLGLGWFPPEPLGLLVLTPLLAAAFALSALLAVWMQEKKLGLRGVLRALAKGGKTAAFNFLAAVMIGMAAGFRGQEELEKPWNEPRIVASELEDTDREDDWEF